MNNKIVLKEELLNIVLLFSKENKIITTNGCFDWLHPGHIKLLNWSKNLGDKLIVGVNSDNSIQRIKGSERPIICENDRLLSIASLSCVDYVCLFDEDEIGGSLIKLVKPNIHVTGSQYKENTPEALIALNYGVKIYYSPDFCDDFGNLYSTTNLISKYCVPR